MLVRGLVVAALDYRVRLSAHKVGDRLRAELGCLLIGSVSDARFSVQRRRFWMEGTGRVMNGVIEQVSDEESVLHVTFRASGFTRFTIGWFFFWAISLQVLFLPLVFLGIRHLDLRSVLLGFIPLGALALGYLVLRAGLWTRPWTDVGLIAALDDVFGDAKA